jgi:hypothetical protein
MTRFLQIMMLTALVAIGTAACKNSENALRDPNSTYSPTDEMGSSSVTQ